MRKLIPAVLLAFAFTAPIASAGCVGSGSYQTCSDSSGNNYNVQRYGNTTNVQGYNSNTGSTWNQRSTNIGNTTYHNGTSANGNNWSGRSTHIGGTTFNSGIDSSGKPYSSTCNQFGCN